MIESYSSSNYLLWGANIQEGSSMFDIPLYQLLKNWGKNENIWGENEIQKVPQFIWFSVHFITCTFRVSWAPLMASSDDHKKNLKIQSQKYL